MWLVPIRVAGSPVSSLNKGGAAVGGGGFDVSANFAACSFSLEALALCLSLVFKGEGPLAV